MLQGQFALLAIELRKSRERGSTSDLVLVQDSFGAGCRHAPVLTENQQSLIDENSDQPATERAFRFKPWRIL
jgi:hypothetical protein